jgi:hypothetical protein
VDGGAAADILSFSRTFPFASRVRYGKAINPVFAGIWIGSSMVEQLTLNQLVEGSSPSRSIISFLITIPVFPGGTERFSNVLNALCGYGMPSSRLAS